VRVPSRPRPRRGRAARGQRRRLVHLRRGGAMGRQHERQLHQGGRPRRGRVPRRRVGRGDRALPPVGVGGDPHRRGRGEREPRLLGRGDAEPYDLQRAVDARSRLLRRRRRPPGVASTLDGRRLCEGTVGLVEEAGLASWQSPGAGDSTEWVSQVRTVSTVYGPYDVQESLHPNYWGQLALRSCVRRAYAGGVTSAAGRAHARAPASPRRGPVMTLQ
jgi:hypothetical protein